MWSNFIITLVGIGSVAYLMKSDVRHGGVMLKRNLKTIRSWLEEEGSSVAAKGSECATCIPSYLPHIQSALQTSYKAAFI
jgi:hypothetical protein